jgi:hypothetical protein
MESFASTSFASQCPLPTGSSASTSQLFEATFDVTASPFCPGQIRLASHQLRCELEVATLRAGLKASELATVHLFCLLAQNAPEVLPATWAAVFEMVVAEERFWVYPKQTLGDIEDGADEIFVPYLNHERLATEWSQLLEHVQRVISTQQSASRHRLSA